MYRTVSLDDQGRIIVICKLPTEQDGTEQTILEKHEDIKHLRRMQSANFIGRTAIKVVDFFTNDRHHAA